MRSVRKELRLTPEMDAAVDAVKGDVSFNRFVERALEKALGVSSGERAPAERGARELPVVAQPSAAPSPAPSRAPEKKVASVDPVLKDPPGDLPRIARRHWA